jgi:hypothetical protein
MEWGFTFVEHGLSNVSGEGFGDGVSVLAALVRHHLDDEAEVSHFIFNKFKLQTLQ